MVYRLHFQYPGGKSPSFWFGQEEQSDWVDARMGEYGWGFPVPEELAPPPVAHEIESAPLSDVFPMSGVFAVSQRFRSIIEEFEPNVHQFFPVTLRRYKPRNKDAEPDELYFILNVCQRFDAVFSGPEKRRPITETERGDEAGKPVISIKGRTRTFSKQKIAGRHLWQGNVFGRRENYISDALADRLKKEKIKFIEIGEKYEEIDAPWDPQENIGPVLEWMAKNPDLPEKLKKLNQEC
ncbi:imm11 family protein [Aestuariibius sp. 2305UL40-4]|uniref:imm11 family protein n=1 Tax=Aestuariibius violaceus TaxID=3234132 RepID=UPI00345EC0D8